MSLARRAKRRDANEAEIVKALHDVGAVVWRLDTPADLLVGFRLWITLEVKDGSKSPSRRALTADEQKFLAACVYHHLSHYVVTSPAEALAAVGVA